MYDYEQPEQCFECSDDLDYKDGQYNCEECGKKYSKEEYEKLVDDENAEYLSFVRKNNPELFK